MSNTQQRFICMRRGAPSLLRSAFAVLISVLLLCGYANTACAYSLLFGKWDDPTRGTGATITWSYIADGAGVDTSNYHDGTLTGTSSIGALRNSIDAINGAGAFDAAVQRAFNTWAAAANLKFVHVADNGAAFAGTTAIDIRIGAYAFSAGYEGSVGYGPPGNDLYFPDPLAGDIAFAANNNFQIASGAEGGLLPTPGGAYSNDIEGLMLHEIGHALGLGHSTNPYAVMCGYVNSSFDGSACHYELINRQLDADDIGGMQFLYGAPASAGDAPLPVWMSFVLGIALFEMLSLRKTLFPTRTNRLTSRGIY